jgi:hypothetical protein
MGKLLGLFFIVSLLASCQPQTKTTPAAAPTLSGSCTVGQWSALGTGNLNLTISSDFSSTEKSLLEQAAGEWNSAIPGKNFFTVPFNPATTRGFATVSEFKDNELGIYKSTAWFPDVSSQALAITQFYGYVRSKPNLGNYIDLTHADIIVNYYNFGNKLTTTLPAYSSDFDLPTVVLHEMGHFLGLCHETTHQSIMQPYYNSTQRTLMAYDKIKINDLYTNNYVTPMLANKAGLNAITIPNGTPIRGVIELRSNGKCMHYINGKLVYEH